MPAPVALDQTVLPAGIRSRFVENINGLRMHVLEAGFQSHSPADRRPCVLLLHGFPELAYSWRKVMLPLAQAGYHVIAPDQRGYGRTTGWDADYDGDLASFRMLNLVRDALGLVYALGYRSVAAVVGHDFGSPVAAWCALLRPDVFRSVVLMSAPFAGPPPLPFDTVRDAALAPAATGLADPGMNAALALLQPPRKHYQWYYSTREANDDMRHCAQGVHAFLRAYYHYKSADWKQNQPLPAQIVGRGGHCAKLPTYYVMDLDQRHGANRGDRDAVRAPRSPHANGCPSSELAVYSAEYARTGFQGGLQWYRCTTSGKFTAELQTFSGPQRSTCRPASSPARATGAFTRSRATSRKCRPAPARACSAATWSTAPATGCSRSSRRQ